jgi:kynurenine formamidase
MCKHHNVSPRKGDILFIRTGVIPEWDSFSEAQKIEYAAQKEPKHAGVEACIETLEWLWDSGIAAVAGDAISWEVRLMDFRRLLLANRRLVSFIRLTGCIQVYPTPGEVSIHEYR